MDSCCGQKVQSGLIDCTVLVHNGVALMPQINGKSAIFARDAGRPNFLTAPFGRLFGIARKGGAGLLLATQTADPPAHGYRRPRRNTLSRNPQSRHAFVRSGLKGFDSSGLMIGNGLVDTIIEGARLNVSLEPRIHSLRIVSDSDVEIPLVSERTRTFAAWCVLTTLGMP